MQEARLEMAECGLLLGEDGWFVVNVADTEWYDHDVCGSGCSFESSKARFTGLGIHIRVLPPGSPNGMYHNESMQEDFLVLSGECLLLVEGQERRLKQWDFVHCPPGTNHIFVGAGDRPCVLVMTSPRVKHAIHYPVSELAREHGASVETATDLPREAYASFADDRNERPAYWDELPWSSGYG